MKIIFNLQGQDMSLLTDTVWGFVSLILTILWANRDADRPDFDKPFDFGFLIYILWPFSFPWYLVTTRGLDGIIMFFGFLALWLGPWLAGLVAYSYYS